jgi:hypothetical protein
MADSSFLRAESRDALHRFDVAEKSGNQRAIADARRDLKRIFNELEKLKAEAITLGEVRKALNAPRRMMP